MRRAIATDVGGGTNYSMLRTLDEGYKVLALARPEARPAARLLLDHPRQRPRRCRSTTGSARLAPGAEADIVVLDSAATPAMALRMETVETLAEELFVLQTLGDDRAVAATYVAGEPAGKSAPAA